MPIYNNDLNKEKKNETPLDSSFGPNQYINNRNKKNEKDQNGKNKKGKKAVNLEENSIINNDNSYISEEEEKEISIIIDNNAILELNEDKSENYEKKMIIVLILDLMRNFL